MESRNQTFQQLKPICVALSQATLALSGPRGDTKLVADHLEQLQRTIVKLTGSPDALDAKLADYIFFPISNVLKASQRVSIRSLELSLEIIVILIDRGWRERMQPQLAAQIVILCTLMAEKRPSGFSFGETTSELQSAALWCLYFAFSASGRSTECLTVLRSESNFPQLGQTITIVLDRISDSGSSEAQIAATSALEALVDNVADGEICASFLPGIVSKLTKVLTPTTKQRRNHQVLIGCLDTLILLLRNTLSDDGKGSQDLGQKRSSILTDAKWKETAATQLKPALTSIMRLKGHSRDDVKESLAKLCLTLVEHCRETLANCSSLATETLITLAAGQSTESTLRIQLEMLLRADPSLYGTLQSTTYGWLQSLPTIMQGADEQAKVHRMQHLSTAYSLLVHTEADITVLDRMLANSLRDSVVATLQSPITKHEGPPFAPPVQLLDQDLIMIEETKGRTDFGQALVQHRGQEDILGSIEQFAKLISSSSSSPAFAADLERSLRFSQGEVQIGNFWLFLIATQTGLQRKDDFSDFVAVPDEDRSVYNEYLEELYSFSISILMDSSDNPPDTRLQALALRTLALRAQTARQAFRYELIDALYPVLHALATPNGQLQADSMITLNIFTSACGYKNIQGLIVENVDYLTNAVALKLNAFDISPQAPQVLMMMVRLASVSLLPYLEDTVESIFAALEDYHGYPLLVEILFRVLGVMVAEGAKEPQLAIMNEKAVELKMLLKDKWRPTDIDGLVNLLHERSAEETEARNEQPELTPQRPWKGVNDIGGDSKRGSQSDEDELNDVSRQDQELSNEDSPPPAAKTYSLLLKIAELTQHFLPSASPSLRVSLLSIIKMTAPAIARHENSFLPLINTLWPEIVSRLEDGELHIQTAALDVVSIFCEYAGDFMKTRIVQLWPDIVEMYRKSASDLLAAGQTRTQRARVLAPKSKQQQTSTALEPDVKQAVMRMRGMPVDYSNTSARLLWDGLLTALTTIVRHTPLPPELFDEALEMLEPVLDREDVRRTLEDENADAVWLARVRAGDVAPPAAPVLPENFGRVFAEVPG